MPVFGHARRNVVVRPSAKQSPSPEPVEPESETAAVLAAEERLMAVQYDWDQTTPWPGRRMPPKQRFCFILKVGKVGKWVTPEPPPPSPQGVGGAPLLPALKKISPPR